MPKTVLYSEKKMQNSLSDWDLNPT